MDSPRFLTPRTLVILIGLLFGITSYAFIFPTLVNARRPQSTATLSAQQQKLTASDGTRDDWFGYSAAIQGDTILVGAYDQEIDGKTAQGSAYVFALDNGTWQQQAKLVASDGEREDIFGISVGLSGDIAVVGAPGDNPGNSPSQGSAYVFVRCDAGWQQQYKLVAGSGAPGDVFGDSVAISGDTVIIGAPAHDQGNSPNEGAAYVYVLNGSDWLLQAELRAADGAANLLFGQAVAIDGDTAIVGADGASGYSGAAYVFTRSNGVWRQQAKLTASDGAAIDYFGFSLALRGDTAVVGAFDKDGGGNQDQGAAYVFQRNGMSWTQQAKLTASDGVAGDLFGWSVAISGDTVVVGADQADIDNKGSQGAVYVFTRANGVWQQKAKLAASDGMPADGFGVGLALDGDRCVAGVWGAQIGANDAQGSAYVISIPCAASLFPTSALFQDNGDQGTVNLSLPDACAWTATSNDPWIAITSRAEDTGPAVIHYIVRDNFTGAARSGSLQIAGQIFTIRQAGGECNYALSPLSKRFSVTGGTGIIFVTTSAYCQWQATTTADWITFSSDTSRTGNGRVDYAVAPNTSSKTRKAKIIVGNRSVDIKQAGQ